MKLSNFRIADDFISIEVGESNFDLHNNFDFISIEYYVGKQILILKWVKSTGDWVPEKSPKSIRFEFSGVSLFKCKERDSDMPYTEDDCLSSMGFIHNELIEEVEGFSSTKPTEDAAHLNFSFMSGFAMKISAKEVKCTVA